MDRFRRAFTLIELLVVVTIIVLLLALLMPAMGNAVKTAQQAACTANERTQITAILNYSADNQARLPVGARTWPHFGMLDLQEILLRSYYGGTLKQLHCPSDPGASGPGAIAGWWRIWFGTPIAAGDHLQPLPANEPDEVDYSYYWYAKMYWDLDFNTGLLINNQLRSYRVTDVTYPSALLSSVCFAGHSPDDVRWGVQGAFIDGHAEWTDGKRILKCAAPWYGEYNLDWTYMGIYGRDVK
jgi:prepilin-type N-terminal cleavage/methylation domain-containing protein